MSIVSCSSEANLFTAGVALLLDTDEYPNISNGSRNISEYRVKLYSIDISSNKFQYYTRIVLFPCECGLFLEQYLPELQFFLSAFSVHLLAWPLWNLPPCNVRNSLGLVLSINWPILPVRRSIIALDGICYSFTSLLR